MGAHWPFDQDRNAAAITTRRVLREGYPSLDVVHYSDDHSWSFTCGTTRDVKDGLVVGMGCIVEMDPTLLSIADLPPAWRACRDAVGSEWERWKNDNFQSSDM
jgi:hypothetical protein